MADERATLIGFLTWQRDTLALKCEGLSPEQMSGRSVAPSTMSLLGLVRHMAEVERGWFRRIMAGEDAPRLYRATDDPDGDWNGAAPDQKLVDEAFDAWRAEIAYADQVVAGIDDLATPGRTPDRWRGPMSLRWVLVHMIEEYARHLGHADLLRERIDGKLGQ
jgi:uncharacterized damage-inducible protein DinB